jgi:hypothetical protein
MVDGYRERKVLRKRRKGRDLMDLKLRSREVVKKNREGWKEIAEWEI